MCTLGIEYVEIARISGFVAPVGDIERLLRIVDANLLCRFRFAVLAQIDQRIADFLVGNLQGVLPGNQRLFIERLGLIDAG